MKDHQLKALVQVADSGSIRAAARAMNLSQSALTKALRELEEDVGTELLQRSYKGIGFTPEGNALLIRARLVLATIDKARAEIRQMRGGAGAHVKAAITPLVTATVLPAVLRAFRKAQPEAELTFHEGLLVQALPELIEGKIDFAIALASPQDLPYEIEFEPLADIDAVPMVRTTHPLADARRTGVGRGRRMGAQPVRRQPEHEPGRVVARTGLPGADPRICCCSSPC